MTRPQTLPFQGLDEDVALRAILEGTASATGQPFFRALVENLARSLGTQGAWVTEFLEECRRLRCLAFWMDGQWLDGYEFNITGTPCEAVIQNRRLLHIPENLIALFPGDDDIRRQGFVSYMGVPLLDVNGAVLGHLAVVDRRPMPEEPRAQTLFRIFAGRAAAELQRLRAEAEVREREEKLSRLVDGAMDGIIELDHRLRVTTANAAAEKMFACARRDFVGREFRSFLAPDSAARIAMLLMQLSSQPEGRRQLWMSEQITCRRCDGAEFPGEITLSSYQMHRETFYAIILRNVHERIEAQERIRALAGQAEYLRQELNRLYSSDEIIGRSEPFLHAMEDVRQVAPADTTVLILGETGTGKELIARAIHAASRRADRPFVTVNCAAIPATLMESEFFGHERGAFTGATQRREGRFALADGGTIFLDEIGDLPLELQAKLLRVLQQGEFEPVGSSKTRRVDVRVVAATNRDLEDAIRAQEFRRDLYYRLNVFPLRLPPLRDRGEDVLLLAAAFAERFARRMHRSIEPLTPDCMRRLAAYNWPGNVRELENVIERAVITSRDGRLNLDRALPETVHAAALQFTDADARHVMTVAELEEIEKRNYICALQNAGWRISGESGAARMLGMKPSTLASRMKALGITRPAQV